ncbi:MAG TPA: Ig-like domain-containing protein, partial [Candidatus Krumholzibacteria bacterium]|nr:Ig-like domain-containing protein [Candidatus Krumholzibacteria bacterium]
MDIRPRFSLVPALVLVVALAACGDDSNPATPNDTTPPGVSTVTPVDDHHIDIAFSEQVTKSSAEDESNYVISPAPIPVSPRGGATAAGGITIAGATLKGDNKTVTVSTDQSMAGLSLQVTVHDVSDNSGNKIGEGGSSKPFTGSNTTDATPPTVVSKAPAAGATNIAVNATVVVNFSEAIQSASAAWFAGPGAGVASASALGGESFTQAIDGSKLTLTLNAPLAYSQLYTVTVNATDFAGNPSGTTQWSFTTQANNDHTPPTLVSTVPANLAAGVDVNSDLSLTFSEAINQSDFNVEIAPDAGDGVATWSNGGKTVTFNPTAPLATDTQYTFSIFNDGVFDLAGNGIVGVTTVKFTTATTLAPGSIAGAVTGDAGTPAANPSGAVVIATDASPFNGDPFHTFGSTKVPASYNYSILYLVDGTYYIVSVKDSNGDGDLDPSNGDAIGGFGVDVPLNDLDPDAIEVAGGAHVTGKNFALYDPSTAS